MFEHHGTPRHRLGKGLGLAVIGAAAITALGFVVMGLWNHLLPGLLGVKTIHFWQALGLLALSRILFGGFHHRGHGFHRRHRMFQRWESMTPEEREQFRHGFRGRCGHSAE